jgi:predicted nucleic acid-binding protein
MKVVIDTSVLINLFHGELLELLGKTSHRWLVPQAVLEELTEHGQRARVEDFIEVGILERIEDAVLPGSVLFERWSQQLGKADAACVALASIHGTLVATDERRAMKRAIENELGKGRIVTTPDLIVTFIREGILTVDQADEVKAVLERNRFKIKVQSFRDLL